MTRRFKLLAMGVTLGLFHLFITIALTWTGRIPFSFLLFIILGPISTIPVSVLAFFFPYIGGRWFIATAAVAGVCLLASIAFDPKEWVTGLVAFIFAFIFIIGPLAELGLMTLNSGFGEVLNLLRRRWS